ncbi:hypothetical protein OJ996_01560 [Luteolibacter sp. GHJ8]|uniref:CHAP domain-containing protein n=1 Tax=Luteolibacter rhizosphaerae TaxID=2989719 RepID=A0ABT3FXD8_9BACT|nr:hypothetical protein [Luteolibacter rhizosphaerae]MCW1912240.1 hypothetical protein [Luteolibacter rhizosphaerae]
MFRCRIVFSLAALAFAPLQAAEEYQYQTGDVVFQSTWGEQAKAVRAATGSRYTHCGVIFEQDGAFKSWKPRSR